MKKYLLKYALPILTAILLAPLFTSCIVDDGDGWYPAPPSGWNYFYDSSLNGSWQLVQANDLPVSQYETNYMYFNGDGRGTYYYYRNGRLFAEDMAYYCQEAYQGASRYQINIQYEYDSPVTMSYWFSGNTLWLQWTDGYGDVTTYLYRPARYIPY